MANNLASNTTEDLLRVFLERFDANKVVINTVDKQILASKYSNRTGGEVSVKRPHQGNTIRTTGGDISSSTKDSITSGKATGEVQDYFTQATEWSNIEEALELDQLDQIMEQMSSQLTIDLETSLQRYMRTNAGLSYGSPGTAVDAWGDVAGAGAFMKSIGVPAGTRYYLMNDDTATNLADTQSGLASGDNRLVTTAWEDAQISRQFGGLRALTSNAMTNYTTGTGADRVGALSATPDGTYVTAKDTMTQALAVSGFEANLVVAAGETIEVTGRYRLNVATREVVVDATGARITWRATVTEEVTLSGAGAGTLIVAACAINEANGQYNNVDSALTSGDVVTLLGSADTLYQPNLFYHAQAFGMATVSLPKLYSTDTVAQTKDGISVRCSKYSDGDANVQKIRFDILPAFITFNPQFAGNGFGK